MKKCYLGAIVAMVFTLSMNAQIKGQDYTIDKNGDVVVAKIIEGLSLQKEEIYTAALKYMENAYKETKYKIVINSPENYSVAGEGMYLQFYDDNIFPYSYFLDAPILLRVDAKDGRARISISLSYYMGKRSNINETIDIKDRISEFMPVNEKNDERRKLYSKAFPELYRKTQKTLNEVAKLLESTRSSVSDTDW